MTKRLATLLTILIAALVVAMIILPPEDRQKRIGEERHAAMVIRQQEADSLIQEKIIYTHDPRTGICFALIRLSWPSGSSHALATVDCNKVKHLIIDTKLNHD